MNFSYRLMYNSGPKSPDEIQITNQCFELWASEFSRDLESRGAKLNLDEFHRARLLAVVQSGDKVAGFHLYSTFDFREVCSVEHSYMKNLSDPVKDRLKEKGVNNFMAMEYLTVAPNFRGKDAGGPKIAEIIIRLGLKVMNDMGADAALGVARVDRKVNFLGEVIGFSEVAQITKYNNACAVMVFDKNNEPIRGDDFTHHTVETLWNNKSAYKRIAA